MYTYLECFGPYARGGDIIFAQIEPFQIWQSIKCFIGNGGDGIAWKTQQLSHVHVHVHIRVLVHRHRDQESSTGGDKATT